MALVAAAVLALGAAAIASACSKSGAPPAGTGTARAASARATAEGVALRRIGTFSEPVYVTAPPRDTHRLFVVEKTGRIVVIRNGRRLARPFLDLSAEVSRGFEQGLLSMAFAPDYARSRRFYVDFTDRAGDTRVQEFKRSSRYADRADRRTRRQVLFQRQPFENHNGGLLLFGPDRLLYVGVGDGGSGGDPMGNGQDLGTLLGKILRIDPRATRSRRYRSPADNPFVHRAGARHEIYAYGLRNPWRFSFDRRTGDMAIADVGQASVEEVDFARRGRAAGANFGWSVFEGTRRFKSGEAPGHVPPLVQRSHADGDCSITGGYVVRDPRVPALAGRYVHGDFCTGDIRSTVLPDGAASDPPLGLHVDQLSSFGEDASGRVYATSLGGPVYRIVAG